MTRGKTVVLFGLLCCAANSAQAQHEGAVQLPSSSIYGADTTVSVPDRGSVSLGGVGRSSTGSTAFGPSVGRGNRSVGSSLSGSSASVRAKVHDIQALDRASNGNKNKKSSAQPSEAARLANARQSSADQVPPGSVADARRRRAAELAANQAELQSNIKQAREAAAAGKPRVAAMFYKLAARQATGELKLQVEKEAAALAKPAQAPRAAHTSITTH
ncbi:MAG TPA: hypothetical protein VHC22_29300 [Pirellulales bacterium]|nr:hypothetical protein [Pirellulales bacterium]